MRARLTSSVVLAIVVLVFTSVTWAADPPASSSNTEVLDWIKQNMVTKDDLKEVVNRKELQTEIQKVTELVAEQDQEIKSLKSELDQVRSLIGQAGAEQQQILEMISRRDSQGRPILALNNIMQESPEFKQELSDAVHSTFRQSGTLRVRNMMTTAQYLNVNGRQELIPAQSSQDFVVRVGTLTTELVGQEAPKNWTIGAPNYLQEINIEPASVSQVIVNRPIYDSQPIIVNRPVVQNPSVIVNRPVVVETPTIIEPPIYYTPFYLY